MSSFTVETVVTSPHEGQKTGTSGLRKKVTEFQKKNYLENWLSALCVALGADLKGSTIVLGGDGRYYSDVALDTCLRVLCGYGVARVLVGQNGLLSTPAVSALIRRKKAFGGIILTASHNPGGPTNDFGIKYNGSNGGPANEQLTSAIFDRTLDIAEYRVAKFAPAGPVPLDTVQDLVFADGDAQKTFTVSVIDSVDEYLAVLKEIFDFASLKQFCARPDFKVVFDGLHGVAGPYAKRIFGQELGIPADCLRNCDPLPDFGGGHPDPNLTYAHDLVAGMRAGEFAFGAAADGDADRNMILGNKFFLNPSDSVALIAAHAQKLGYGDLKAIARSMPTSGALDRVARDLGLKLFEVPTGWKFFGNIMDHFEAEGAPLGVICGEESFGTGSSHVREKDGLWAVLMGLAICASHNPDPAAPLVSLEQIVGQHWAKYGRNYFTRYDFEEVESAPAKQMMEDLRARAAAVSGSAKPLAEDTTGRFTVQSADDFEYNDPFDKSVSKAQGVRFMFTDGSRFVFRLSGTGSSGATIRLYCEQYVAPDALTKDEPEKALAPLIQLALAVSQLQKRTGRDSPTVIT